MTEHFYDPDDIGTMMTMAKEIMDCLNNQMNAYVWWYLRLASCNNSITASLDAQSVTTFVATP